MRIPYPGTDAVDRAVQSRRSGGRWLLAVRGGWAALTVCTLGLFLAALPARYAELVHPAPALRGALERFELPTGAYAGFSLGLNALYLLGSVSVAGLLVARRRDDRMALFVAAFLVSFAAATSSTIDALALQHRSVDAFTTLVGALGYIGLNGLFYLFPDGRFVPRWTWVMLAIAVVGQAPFSMPDTSPYNPNSWPAPLKLPLLLGIFGTAIFAQIYRYRRVSNEVQRQQTKWVLYGATAAIALMFVARSGDPGGPGQGSAIITVIQDPLLDLAFLLIPLSIGISVLRYRLWDIDLIVNRTLVYGALTACVIGLYILIVGYLGTVLRTGNTLPVSLAATGAVAVLFQPLREYVQRSVNRLMYGKRDDPYGVLSGLGKRLEASLAPDAALPTIVETVARELKLPYAAIALRQQEGLATETEYGAPVEGTLRLPLTYGADTVGEMVLGLRAGESAFRPADRCLLEDLARQAGVAAYATRLTTELRHSRQRLVTAREEERRRLRRDLHDGLGPALGAFSLKVGAARNILPRDGPAADALLAEVIGEVETAVGDVRRLVYGLRPPSLDELGLVGAIRALVRQSDVGQAGDIPQVRVEAPGGLPPLPAAIEVAAYRIVQEALTNVVRHASACACTVCLSADGRELEVRIEDDGAGMPAGHPAGVGLLSMRERAEELGGTCAVEPRTPRGTTVTARLPLSVATSHG